MGKKLYIETLGCAMNARDSEHIIAELEEKESYTLTENPKDADLILINTCVHDTIDDSKANKKSISLCIDQLLHFFQILYTLITVYAISM